MNPWKSIDEQVTGKIKQVKEPVKEWGLGKGLGLFSPQVSETFQAGIVSLSIVGILGQIIQLW